MRYCQHCAHVVPEDARFCPACGRELSPRSTEPTAPIGRGGIKVSSRDPRKDNNKRDDNKKQSSLWGCTLVLLLVALGAGGLLYTYTQLFDRSGNRPNILAPEDDVEEDTLSKEQAQTAVVQEAEKQPAEGIDANSPQGILRRRVQNIYAETLATDSYLNGINRYCTEYLKTLVQNANMNDPEWIDFNPWVFSNDYNSPRVENIKILDFSGFEATVKVTIRPYSEEDIFNFVTLTLIKEEDTWLIDDLKSNGTSIRTRAQRAAEDAEIIQEIINDPLEY